MAFGETYCRCRRGKASTTLSRPTALHHNRLPSNPRISNPLNPSPTPSPNPTPPPRSSSNLSLKPLLPRRLTLRRTPSRSIRCKWAATLPAKCRCRLSNNTVEGRTRSWGCRGSRMGMGRCSRGRDISSRNHSTDKVRVSSTSEPSPVSIQAVGEVTSRPDGGQWNTCRGRVREKGAAFCGRCIMRSDGRGKMTMQTEATETHEKRVRVRAEARRAVCVWTRRTVIAKARVIMR